MRVRIALAALAAAAGAAVLPAVSTPGAAAVPPHHANSYPVHPGVAEHVADVPCEVGVLLKQRHTVYAGLPASCFGTDDGTLSNGCHEAQIPYSTPVAIRGAKRHASFVYSSFTEMQLRGTHRHNVCYGNNLALAKLSAVDARRATPTIPLMGTPHRPNRAAPGMGESLSAYIQGRQSATAGATSDGGWHHAVTIMSNVTSADVGAPVVTSSNRILGLVSVIPTTTSMNESLVSDLMRELRFLRRTPGFHHIHLLSGPVA